jgi:uncharacterized hydrophobic protein (TIGR00271 family)
MSLINKILEYFNLDGEIDDYDKIHESILKDISFKGTNLWILIFAILIASVGLNMNSTAVIIGAMLISPLMGPINGMGYSIATYDFALFKRANKNFFFAVATSLAASTTYFYISPISTAHSELLARTSPTIYDVLIALFGGIAGIVAASSRNKGNVIPGVAIATALMPPLCTAGYGLATGQFDFFLGAFYLFTINTVFIALSSVAVSQILKFPIRNIPDAKEKIRVNSWISAIIFLVLVPSIYFGYLLVQKEKFHENATRYVSNVSNFEGYYLLNHSIEPSKNLIKLVYGGSPMNDVQKQQIMHKAFDFKLDSPQIIVQQGLTLDIENSSLGDKEIMSLKEELFNTKFELDRAKKQIDSTANNLDTGKQLLKELKALFPEIETCTYASGKKSNLETSQLIHIISIESPKNQLNQNDKKRIKEWVVSRFNNENVKIWFE